MLQGKDEPTASSLHIRTKELKKYLTVSYIGGTRVLVPRHQNSGAPTFFFGVFLMVFSNLCWQCSDKTRKCQEHINTLRKKEKLAFLKPILKIKTKKPVFNLKGHQNSGARAPELWCPHTFLVFSWLFILIYAGSVLIKQGNVRNT